MTTNATQSNTQKIPKLRFPGFSGKWEEKKLGETLKQEIREIPKPDKSYMAIGIRSHFKGTFQKPDSDPRKINMENLFIVKEDDLIVNITFAWEGAVAIVKKEDEGGLVSHRFPAYVFNKNITSPKYFQFIFPNKKTKYRLTNISPGGAGRNRVLNKKDFLKLTFDFPSLPEQQKIADFLGAVDEWIDNLKSQKEFLEGYKRGMMQKIFSQEIRFRNEDGSEFPEWEEKKLGEVGNFLGGGTPSKNIENFWKGNIPWVSSSDVSDKDFEISITRFITDDAIEKSATKIIPKDSLLIVSRVGVGKIAISNVDICTSQDFTNFLPDKNFNVLFGAFLLKNKSKILLSFNQGTSIKGFTKDDLVSLKINLPSLPEQQKIADFLSSIDNLIEAKSAEIEKAEEWKKGVMQGVFV